MAGLQRSNETFRRSGSSGLVWEDRFLSEEMDSGGGGTTGNSNRGARGEEEGAASSSASATVERSRSNGGRGGYRTGRVSPALDPPSPKVSVCGFCAFFGKPRPNSNTNRRR